MRKQIPESLSLYFDFARLLASIIVVFHHTWPLVFPSRPIPWPGHAAVVVFFVLSGYVITHASQSVGLRTYTHHRLARILPVAWGSLLLSVAISGLAGTPEVPDGGRMAFEWRSIGINLAFLGQSWVNVAPVFNPPFWSLNYEVWYYIIFGTWFFAPTRFLVIPVAMVAGPRILLLMPVWLLGVLLYRRMPTLDVSQAKRLFIGTAIAALALYWFDVSVLIRENMRVAWPAGIVYAQGSGMFVGDFILGLVVALNFAAVASLRMELLFRAEKLIRYLSTFTFSIYVFHMPFVILIWNGFKVHNAVGFYAILILSIYCAGQLTERRTRFYRAALDRWPVRWPMVSAS